MKDQIKPKFGRGVIGLLDSMMTTALGGEVLYNAIVAGVPGVIREELNKIVLKYKPEFDGIKTVIQLLVSTSIAMVLNDIGDVLYTLPPFKVPPAIAIAVMKVGSPCGVMAFNGTEPIWEDLKTTEKGGLAVLSFYVFEYLSSLHHAWAALSDHPQGHILVERFALEMFGGNK